MLALAWLAQTVLVQAMLAQGATVKQDRTPLRKSCDPYDELVVTLSKGTPVGIRFAVSGESLACYKVTVQAGGKTLDGYLPGSAMDGLDEFEQSRRAARMLDFSQVLGPAKAAADRLPPMRIAQGDPLATNAAALLEAHQPARALEMLEPEMKKRPSADLLTLAGVAAWQSDHSLLAVEYLRAALAKGPSDSVERLLHQVERESRNDKSGNVLIGMRVQLRYEAPAIADETARQLLGTLDEEFARISAALGCSSGERVSAIAQSREAYRQTTNAAEWSGGQFDGKIRVPMVEGRLDGELRRTLAHEITHACLSMLGRWPAWLQEGIAQKLSGEPVAPGIAKAIAELARAGQLPKLASLGQDWSRLDTAHAEIAYGLSLRAVDLFLEEHPAIGLRNLMKFPERLPAITAELDKLLSQRAL